MSKIQPDLSKFKCYRFGQDGSTYYGETAYLNVKTGAITHEAPADDEAKKHHKLVRHGLGLQLFSGSKNEDGVMTRYEGGWDRDKKHGDNCKATFADGSVYVGSFKRDQMEGHGKYDWAIGHKYEGLWKESQMDGQGKFVNGSNGRQFTGAFKRNLYLQDKIFVNPLDEEKRQQKVLKY